LTEVVHAPNSGAPAAPKLPGTDEIVRTILDAVRPVMQQRLAEEAQDVLRVMVEEKMSILHARLQEEMEILVRQVASETLISLQKTHA
jgi:hypothetical protein